MSELHHLLSAIWIQEVISDEFALGDMLMHYKKKSKDDRGNYRALGLLNHSYKILAMVILGRILPYIILVRYPSRLQKRQRLSRQHCHADVTDRQASGRG